MLAPAPGYVRPITVAVVLPVAYSPSITRSCSSRTCACSLVITPPHVPTSAGTTPVAEYGGCARGPIAAVGGYPGAPTQSLFAAWPRPQSGAGPLAAKPL